MQIAKSKEEKLLQKRKFFVRFIIILMILLLIGFNIGSWLFLNKMTSYLEAELAKRLFSIAELAANNIEFTPIDDIALINKQLNPSDYLLIQGKLRSLQLKYELEGAYIIDSKFQILMAGSENFPPGEKLTYIQQDSLALYQAWTGNVAVSPLHIVEGNRFKTVYAPITNIMAEVTALLVLEANAEFFHIIRVFKRGLIIGGLASFGAIIIFSFFLSWTVNLFIKTQDSLRKTEKLALLGQMSASVAHEIRNPLGVIKATADVLKLKYGNKEQSDELFDYIGKEVRRLNNLVSHFLSFARETKLTIKTGDIINTVQKAVSAFERDCQGKNISISMNIKNDVGQLKFDEEKIQQVLFNLLVNASQAMENGGNIIVDIGRYSTKGRSYAEIKIKDNGIGIEGDLQRIFEPFYTTKSSGSGLGLAITKQIIEKHGGWIDLESIKNKGTTVKFYLPLS